MRTAAAVVESVRLEVVPFVPGVTEGDENEQKARAGRFEQLSEIGLLKAPIFGVTVTV